MKLVANHKDTVGLKGIADYLAGCIQGKRVVFVCIGTDRSTGDALGPLVGANLETLGYTVYGTLDEPVHANNLHSTVTMLAKEHPNDLIIAVDACLGKLDSVGKITVADGPMKPGAGVGKNLPLVGQVHLTGVVNISGFMEYLVLQNTRLSLVMAMAKGITDTIVQAYKIAGKKVG